MPRKLLLSSVCRPFGEKYGDGFGVSYEGSHQLLWAQGIFRTRGVTTQWGIDFIAENLEIPTITLHYPSIDEFIKEIRKGYDYIGIAFVASTMHKMTPMVEAIRLHAPESKIVLGGYGTALGEEVEQWGDYICKGEGVAFMRELLGEPLGAPFRQPFITQTQALLSLPMVSKTGYVFAGLGCPNGCDFCATSYYYQRRHLRLLPDGPSILAAIEKMRERDPGLDTFWINDDDFLLNEKRGRGFLEAIRRSDMPPLGLSVFSSVKALSQFTAAELVEMGIDWVWVGFEGKRAGYSKMEGRPFDELFADLHAHGISVMASMIIGFDYQTPEVIEEEFQELMSMRPTMCQFLIYGPPHGTPSYARMLADDRLRPEIYSDHTKHDGFSLVFKHPHIGPEDMSAIQRSLFKREFEILGPSVFRITEDWLTGYENLKDHEAPRVRAKAERYGKDCHRVMSVIPASKRYVNSEVAADLHKLQARLESSTGPMTLKEKLIAAAAPGFLYYTHVKQRWEINQQPHFIRRTFRTEAQAAVGITDDDQGQPLSATQPSPST